MNPKPHTCSNCTSQFDATYTFCPYCGQKRDDELTLGVLFYNTISNYFSFDARFFKSFIPLMIKPGFLPKEFVGGKRLTYIHPAQMYLFVTVIFFFIFSFTVRDSRASIDSAMKENFAKKVIDSVDQGGEVVLDSAKVEQMLKPLKDNQAYTGMSDEEIKNLDSIIKTSGSQKKKYNSNFNFNEEEVDSMIQAGATDEEVYKFMGMSDDAGYIKRKFYSKVLKFYKSKDSGVGAIYQAFFDSIPIAMFFLLPIFALLFKLFYYRKGRFAHHLVFSFYFFCFLFMVFTLELLVNKIVNVPDWIDWLIAFSTFFYLFIAVKRFYGQGWILSYFKTAVISFLFLLLIIPMAAGIVGMFAFMYY
ncbi:MAG TPA: DUF3667 domain-containing protein [Flavobacteriaceae bacterium]|nr:DUF3667 domain-containing protein [Flavobacteriaceae bacterium]